jgi:chorismate mutase
MASPEPTIDDLRREIDAIDDAMHDLVVRRGAAGIRARAADGAAAIHPAREAAVLRRLLRRHRGPFPGHALVRIWCELIGGAAHMGQPFSVAVHAPEKSVGYWDVARDHFGSATHMTLHRSARRVVREVAERRAAIGVLALPSDGESDPWWPLLMGAEAETPRVVARLPFVDNAAGRFEDLGALAIARVAHEPTGEDSTLFALELGPELSRARLRESMAKAGFEAEDVAAWSASEDEGTRLALIEVRGHVGTDDRQFAELETVIGKALPRVVRLGAFAVPIGTIASQGR